MEGAVDCVLKTHGLAFGTGAIIFLITLFLVARRIIGFTLSLILMLIALGASLAIDHQETVKSFVGKLTQEEQKAAGSSPSAPAPTVAPTGGAPAKPAQPAPENLKGRVQSQKERIEQFMETQDNK